MVVALRSILDLVGHEYGVAGEPPSHRTVVDESWLLDTRHVLGRHPSSCFLLLDPPGTTSCWRQSEVTTVENAYRKIPNSE